MILPLDSTLCLMTAIPAGVAITQSKDGATRAWCGALLLLALAIGVRPWIPPLDRLLFQHPQVPKGLAIAAGALAIVCAIRSGSAIAGTLMISGAGLLALRALGLVG